MSSVGSADKRSAQDEALRRTRETYQEKETEQAKGHSTEMKRMSEAHQAELRELQTSHDSQMEDLKTKARDAISNRDMKYQKEIEDLRGMHQTQVRRQALDAEGRVQLARQTAANEIEHTGAVKDQQKQVMKNQYEDQIARDAKRFEDVTNKSREKVQETIQDQRERLGQAHQKELKAVTTDRDRTKAQTQMSYENMRKTKDGQLRDLEQAKRLDNERLSSHFSSTMREQGLTYDENLNQAREGFREGLDKNRGRYEKALENQAAVSKNSNEAFKSTTSDRINNRLNAGKAENAHLKNELTRQQTSLMRAKNKEVQNVRDSMQANIENLEEQRLGTVEASNDKNRQEINRVQKQGSETLNRTNRFFQDKLVTDRGVANERHENMKTGFEKRLQMSEINADSRANKLLVNNAREEEMLKGFYDKSSVAQRDNFETSLRDLRETNKRDQDLIFQNFSKQSTEREMKYQTKLNEINGKFEGQIQSLKEDSAKQMQNQVAAANKEKKVLVDQKNIEIQRQASQYENRIAKLEETHKREVDGINRRHEESLVSLTRSKGRP